MDNGKKLESKYLDPIDNILYDISFNVGKVFIKINITPNMITTMSLLFALSGIHNIYNNNYKIGAVLWFIGYYFDCMDGSYARTYKLTSKFGDIYDHVSDWLKVSLLIITVLLLNIKTNTKIIIGIITIFFIITTCIYNGYEEKIKKNSNILSFLTLIHGNPENIIYFKYAGSGVTNLVISLIIFNLRYIDYLI
tara:strand:- start:36 stop:617 length:582 start_codon:yes stop_codon:yes gene_type:complete